jgi:Dyp-type peroxidase family
MATPALKSLAKLVSRKKKQELPAMTGDKLVRDCGVSPAVLPIESTDVQGLVFRGYGQLPECSYVLLQLGPPARARKWLRGVAARVSPGVPAAREQALQVAFTYPGLAALGLPDDLLRQFSRTFIEGMVSPHKSRFLGDVESSAPEHWAWGGPGTPVVHVLLMVYADAEARLTALTAELEQGWTAAGLSEVRRLRTSAGLGGREHFGFVDGISQPAIEGYHPAPTDLHLIKPGEFLLGYVNEYGGYTERPKLAASRDPLDLLPLDVEGSASRDLGRNGTYLVMRQLRQDVPAFRTTLDTLSRRDDGGVDVELRARLAAQMVGRWPSGASLVEAPQRDEPSRARANEFRYHDADPEGLKCPIGAHVRRANPRDALAPQPGTDRSLAVNHRHRLIRRGRAYGTPLPEGTTDAGDRGLFFVAVNANLTRQFDFVQHSWLIDPRFGGLSRQADPIVGAAADNEFEAPGDPVRTRCTGLPRFVTVAGGAYFFMPGIRALTWLARSLP